MSIGKSGRVRPNDGVHAREFDGEMVLLDLDRGEYFGLDELGCVAWKGFVNGESPQEIADRIGPEQNVASERLLSDLVALADELVARKLAVPR
jgi:hypothetical protein